MALRAAGHGLRTCVLQFIKSDLTVGELAAVKGLSQIEIRPLGRGFLPDAGDAALGVHRAAAQDGLRTAAQVVAGGQFAIVVLDEVCLAVARGLLEEREVIGLIRLAPPGVCLVLTGRGATPGLVAMADTVTEMLAIRHGLASGITAQKGVEW
jgi:cob(I)alamin adenosyltransferase